MPPMPFELDRLLDSIVMKKDDFFGRDREEQIVSDLHLTGKEVREACGLRPMTPGKIRCLNCDQWFNSWDTTLNRRCDKCKSEDEHEEVWLEELEGLDLWDTTLIDDEME